MRPLGHKMEVPSIVRQLEGVPQSPVEPELVELALCKKMREPSRCFLINIGVLDMGAASDHTIPVLEYDVVSDPLLMFCA